MLEYNTLKSESYSPIGLGTATTFNDNRPVFLAQLLHKHEITLGTFS